MPLIKTESRFFIFLVGLAAVSVATWAAVFSVTGLSMLYSGSLLYVAIAMGVLEFSKIIVASYLYRHWQDTKWWLKTYLSVALILLMLITSGGIYGYLTNSYQGATVGLEKINSQTEVLNQRKINLAEERDRITSDLERLRSERRSIVDSRASEIQANDEAQDSLSVKYRAYRNRRVREQYKPELDNIDAQINKYMSDLDSTNVRLSRANDDIANQKLEIIDSGVEIGPLIYMARIFNTSMDNVMKWFTLVIVFVFDPLAIALVLALNVIIARQPEKVLTEIPTGVNFEVETPVAYTQEDDDEIKRAIDSIDEEDEDDEIVLEEPDDLSFMKDAKPVEQAFADIKEKVKKLREDQVELDGDFVEALDETTKKVGKDKPSRPRFSAPNPKPKVDLIEPLEELVEEIEETPTKDIVVPIKDEKPEGHELLSMNNYEFSPRPEIEHDLIEDEDDEIDIDFDDVIKDEYKQEELEEVAEENGDPEEKYNEEIQPKIPLTDEEIKDMFEEGAREARQSQIGKVSSVVYEPGGKVKVDHTLLDQDENVDFAKQE